MRIVVVLPQPEGPRRTRNSLSRTPRLRSATAVKPPNFLTTSLNVTEAIVSTLDGAEGKPAHEVFLDDEGEDDDRDARHESGGADLAPIGLVLGHAPGDPDRQRHRLFGLGQDQSEKKLVP